MDLYAPAGYQTKCSDITSRNIIDYFIDNFKKMADTNTVYIYMNHNKKIEI